MRVSAILAGVMGFFLAAQAVAAPPSSGPVQYVLYDGESGASRDYWNRGAGLHWRNSCGDWRDANDQAQGAAAFAKASLRGPNKTGTGSEPNSANRRKAAGREVPVPVLLGPAKAADAKDRVDLDATALAKHWLAHGNTGALVRAARGNCELASRENADASQRPMLVVTTGEGEWTCPCTADVSLNRSTYRGLGRDSTLRIDRSGATGVLQFDLSKVKGTVTSAALSLHPQKRWGDCELELMRLDPPAIHTGGKPLLGIAQKYPLDKGIAAHPDVVFATDFAGDDWRTRLFTEGRVSDPTFGRDAMLNSTYIRGQFIKGDVGSCSLDYRWTTHKQPEPEEIYFRYYVLLEKDFGSTVDGNKMPGLAGRYGRWNGRYWSPCGGNGGDRTTGLVSATDKGPERCGWSMRGVALGKPADDNPYRELVPVITYAYHADQAGCYGDDWRWATVLLEKDRWYSIEQYVKVNTIEGPFDKAGNGTGRRDGVLRVWLDGVQVFEKTDIRFRHHPDIKIDEVWLNWYHGGTRPAAATHHWRMANVVVARSYIGPLAFR